MPATVASFPHNNNNTSRDGVARRMDRNAILVKTGKGAEEVKSRTYGLAARLRSVLIMVDGKSTAAALLTRFGAIPDIENTLQMLLDQGYLEARAPAPPPMPAPAAAADAPPAPPETRKDAVAQLSHILLASMGPDADAFTSRIERAKTRVDFEKAAEQCVHVLESLGTRGKARAQRFQELAAVVSERFFAPDSG